MDEKTFLLVTRAHCGNTMTDAEYWALFITNDAEYWALFITPTQARQWLEAMDRVKALQKDTALLVAGSVYGVECFCPSSWMACLESEQDELEEKIENCGSTYGILLVRDGGMEALGLVEPEDRFDCGTVTISDDSLLFQANFKYGENSRIESDPIPAGVLEAIANSDEVNDGK